MKSIKNNNKWILGVVIIILIISIFSYKDLQHYVRVKKTKNNQEVHYLGENGKNVFELLQKSHDVEYSKTDLGIFIVSIDNLKSTGTNYWIYYIDGKMSNIAADKYVTKNNQIITWKYEKLQ
jgi:hypothetical protein